MNTSDYKTKFSLIHELLLDLNKIDHKNSHEVYDIVNNELISIEKSADELLSTNSILRIGVVGQVKAGKSSFLNSLFFDGESVLPKASTPMTAGLTILEYGESNTFSIEYYNTKEWDVFVNYNNQYDGFIRDCKAENPELSEEEIIKKIDPVISSAHELVTSCSNKAKSKIQENPLVDEVPFSSHKDLQDTLNNYVGADGDYTSVVKCLTIKLHDERLKELQIVDTPGVNDPVVSREQRTREFLRSCHGVFFLSLSSRFFDSTDVSFLSDRIGGEGIGTVVLLASKYDSVLQDVGIKFNDDIEAANNNCISNLKLQFKRNNSQSSFKGEEPLFNTTSAIGFSIYKKPSTQWDSMESHVVKQMQKFYPSYFTSEKEIKDMFYALSNIEEIKSDYLDKIFSKNKDKIINEKLNSYFSSSTVSLEKMISDKINSIATYISDLNGNDLSKVKSMISIQERTIKSIEQALNNIASRATANTERYINEVLNENVFIWDRKIPISNESITITRKSTIVGWDKDVECSYRTLKPNDLILSLENKLKSYLDAINKEWETKNNKLRDEILNKFSAVISKSEADNTDFNGEYLNQIVEDVYQKMQTASSLNTHDLIPKFENDLEKCLTGSVYSPESLGSMSAIEAQNQISKKSELLISQSTSDVQSCVDSILDEVPKLLQISANHVTDIVQQNKQKFIDQISESADKYTNNLKKDLQDKERNISLLTESKNVLIKIKESI
jgi:hypothetical protein